jgi:hypothetical protein
MSCLWLLLSWLLHKFDQHKLIKTIRIIRIKKQLWKKLLMSIIIDKRVVLNGWKIIQYQTKSKSSYKLAIKLRNQQSKFENGCCLFYD